MISFKKEFKAVNNKNLVSQITTFTEELILTVGPIWNDEEERETLTRMISQYLEDLSVADEVIEQHKIVCDRRNNKLANNLKGVYNLDIIFRQKNCLNVTKILYTINTNANADLLAAPDFVI